ncbi:hypothetical protein SAMN05880590_113117 [Rhizobium sp. RU35A]|uniref:lysozyme inhibitor LprI family protein n=1 Tax=Rhizobium sp. RU35A TaxID=1907414 RepID=UPI0009561F27|nr:hypothetical protein [Rhizobium sp. RU35A]SIR19066.1 hypothetical protein SAMN05880590_113117 [Rhizobium sp. RU35A]
MKRIILFLSLTATLVATTPLMSPRVASAASFDCTKTDLAADEKEICAERSLNDLDVKMVTTFDLLVGLVPMGNRDILREGQVNWLKTRQACGGDQACLRQSYEARLKELDEAYRTLIKPL